MGPRHYISFSAGIDFRRQNLTGLWTSEIDVCGRQILMSSVDPHTERVNMHDDCRPITQILNELERAN